MGDISDRYEYFTINIKNHESCPGHVSVHPSKTPPGIEIVEAKSF